MAQPRIGNDTRGAVSLLLPCYWFSNGDPMEAREMIRKATLQAKQRRGPHYPEEM